MNTESALSKVKLHSRPAKSTLKGNVAKYRSYKEAWARVSAASSAGFYLEAVTILESIITDRLDRYLGEMAIRREQPSSGRSQGLSKLIEASRRIAPTPTIVKGIDDLWNHLDAWRLERNEVVHGIVKSPPDADANRIETFLQSAERVAAKGALLARAVSIWCEQQKGNRVQAKHS